MSIKISTLTIYHVTFDLTSTRSIYTEDMKQFYNCIQIDEMFFAQCFKVENLDDIQIVGCHLEIQKDSKSYEVDDETTVNIIVGKEIVHSNKRSQLQFPCNNQNKLSMTSSSPRISLENWMKEIEDPALFWDHFTTSFSPIDLGNPMINIELPQFIDKTKFKNSQRCVTIETLFGKLLYHGPLKKGKIEPENIEHPGWNTKLKITVDINSQNLKVLLDVEFSLINSALSCVV